MGFERRQPSQDFGPLIGGGEVMTVVHVETIGAVGRRDSITIPVAGGIEKIANIILRVGGVDINIISLRIMVIEGCRGKACEVWWC